MAQHIDRSTVSRAPHQIQIEITTRCNYTCVMCPHGIGAMQSMIDAPPDLVDRILNMLDDVETIHPTGTGEPLMADGFWRIVDELKGRAAPKLSFHTNGLLLTEANIDRLALAPIHHVVVSLDAASSNTYARIRGGNLERIVRNSTNFSRKVKQQQPNAFLQMSMVLMVENHLEAPDFVRLAHSCGYDVVAFNHMTDPNSAPGAWVAKKAGFRFEYYEQWIKPGSEHADASDQSIIAALDVADELGVHVAGLGLFANQDARAFNDRPSRRIAAQFYS